MGARIYTEVYDDIDETVGDVNTYIFGWDGIIYEIDLGPKNATRLSESLAEFISAARIKDRGKRKYVRRQQQPAHSTSTNEKRARTVDYPVKLANGKSTEAEARRWALANGVQVNSAGRVPTAIVHQFLAAESPDLDVQDNG